MRCHENGIEFFSYNIFPSKEKYLKKTESSLGLEFKTKTNMLQTLLYVKLEEASSKRIGRTHL